MTINIVSSHTLSPSNKEKLENKLDIKFNLSENLKEKIIFKYFIDESLVIGLLVQVGDKEYYYNLDNQIKQILNQIQ